MRPRPRWLAPLIPPLAATALVAPLTAPAAAGSGVTSRPVPATSRSAPGPTPTPTPTLARLSGPTRYETGAAIAAEVGPQRGDADPWLADPVLVVRGDRPLDAAARGAHASMVLPIPPRGPIPAAVRAVLARHAPPRAVVVGDRSILPDAQVKALLGRIPFVRDTRGVLAASADSGVSYRGSDDGWALVGRAYVVSPRVLAEAAAAAHLRPTPVVVLPESGPVDARLGSTSPADLVWTGPFTRIGPVSAQRVVDFVNASMRRPDQKWDAKIDAARAVIAGADRYETAALVARRAYPEGARTVYLAGPSGVDAAFGVGLPGPVLLVPPGGALPPSVRHALAELRPTRLVALGDAGVVSDGMLSAAARATPPRAQERAVAAAGGCLATDDGAVRCLPGDRPSYGPELPLTRRQLAQVGRVPGRIVEMAGDDMAGYSDQTNAVCARSDSGAVACTTIGPERAGYPRLPLVTPPGLEAGAASIRVLGDALYTVTAGGRLLRSPLREGVFGAAVPVSEAGADVRRVAVDPGTACVLTTGGAVRCWGHATADASPRPPRVVPGLPAPITDLDFHYGELVLRTADGRAHVVPTERLVSPGPGGAQLVPFRVAPGVRMRGYVPTLDDPATLRNVPTWGVSDAGPALRAAAPVVSRGGIGHWFRDGLVVLADGRAQWLDDLPRTPPGAADPPRFVLGFGG